MPENEEISDKYIQTTGLIYPQWRRRIFAIVGLLAVLIVVIVFAASIGSVEIPFTKTAGILFYKLPFVNIISDWDSTVETIVLDIRLPRVILAGLVGAALLAVAAIARWRTTATARARRRSR